METLYDVYRFFCEHSGATTIGSFLFAIAIEKSKTIKFNPFSFLGELIAGRFMKVVEKNHKEDIEERKKIHKRMDTIERSLEKARQDSIDRYDKSCQKYDELKIELRYEMTSATMKQYRVDFFRFEEGILRGVKYTKEHWHNMRNKVIEYESFCQDNDKFINSECENAMKTILDTWKTHPWEENDERHNEISTDRKIG